ncbi:MAG TPA: CAP domain-containing protein [Bacteroidales bacterium]|jgi:uncharacterized protein YkwD|nr:CAP domain-containing protein [Bacteroidales bacterium]HNV95401.1 CAP domain-containing protein [Bacteroidales bacterium]HOU98138.1 CAP domain-containing protein [Bacteroidales bacterium]
MKLVLVIIFFLQTSVWAQEYYPDSIVAKCNTAKSSSILNKDEKEVIMYVNMARAYPQYFLMMKLNPYLESINANKNDFYIKTLISTLKKAKPLHLLYYDEKLSTIAKNHAKLIGSKGIIRHNTGNNYLDGENIDYNDTNPLEIVIDLLIDHGVSSLGHRKNILDFGYRQIGVGIAPHKVYGKTCVMDFKR